MIDFISLNNETDFELRQYTCRFCKTNVNSMPHICFKNKILLCLNKNQIELSVLDLDDKLNSKYNFNRDAFTYCTYQNSDGEIYYKSLRYLIYAASHELVYQGNFSIVECNSKMQFAGIYNIFKLDILHILNNSNSLEDCVSTIKTLRLFS